MICFVWRICRDEGGNEEIPQRGGFPGNGAWGSCGTGLLRAGRRDRRGTARRFVQYAGGMMPCPWATCNLHGLFCGKGGFFGGNEKCHLGACFLAESKVC